jgi:ATP-dependent helicase YprA (DUF1998 family)
MTLRERMGRGLRQHLVRLDLERAMEAALAEQAVVIAAAAREAGADSGEVRAAGTEALVGWRSAALRRRESGDAGVPPRPVLAPVALAHGGHAAEAVGAAVADALRGA